MSKLSLHVDDLEVQSFATTDATVGRGTVRGMDSATIDQDSCVSCNGQDTCGAATCAGATCAGASCGASCASCPVSCNPIDCPSSDGRCDSADGRC